jgi:hypothetical protein
MTTPVSFELAKLLKDKGFDESIDARWYYDYEYLNYKLSLKGVIKWNPKEDSYPAPTIAEVVMWLYEKHGIWIYLVPAEDNKDVFKPFFRGKNIIDQHLTEFFNSPTEAYEAGIEYTLNNLI